MMNRLPIAIVLLALTGCVTSTTQTMSNGDTVTHTSAGPAAVDQAIGADPSATRLHDISGALLQYYLQYAQWPAKLDDLKVYSDIESPLILTSPGNGEPYVYEPNGLWTAGKEDSIVVYDPAVSKHGQRWCLFMSSSGRGAPKSLDVLPVPEPIFRGYLPRTGK